MSLLSLPLIMVGCVDYKLSNHACRAFNIIEISTEDTIETIKKVTQHNLTYKNECRNILGDTSN